MKKTYYLVKTGEPIPVGKDIQKVEKISTPFGKGTRVTTIPLTEETIPALIKAGIITDVNPKEFSKDLEFYLDKIASKMNWKVDKVCNYLNTLMSVNPASALSVVLKTIAIDMDKRYPDYIGDSPKIYTISMLNGEVVEVDKKSIKNYRNFAAFRTIEDAATACHICNEQLAALFND